MAEMNNREKGSRYEDMAASFYEGRGACILERNYRRKTGEIDLIVREEGRIVFVEVKYRKEARKGDPSEAVTPSKQLRIYRTARWYLNEKKLPESTPCRFDVISILGTELRHIPNAFGGF